MNRRTIRSGSGDLAGAWVVGLAAAAFGCGSSSSQFGNGRASGSSASSGGSVSNGGSASSGGGTVSAPSSGGLGSGAGAGTSDSGSSGAAIGGDGGTGQITAIVRDFRFYDPADPSTDPDFENPPYGLDSSGNPAPQGGYGPWDDLGIVMATLGTDGKPVYAKPAGTTVTTHGKASFDAWYHDVSGTNYPVSVPLALTPNASGGYTYDSNVSGIPYDVPGQMGDGFFPIDDGTPYHTPFGNQIPTTARPPYTGASHNYSFTVEIDTVFTYQGGETFSFRGDDDVFVFIDGHLVIDLGGIHAPETAGVNIDSLGLTVGKSYALDFFSAERHVSGSNIEFTTTLHLTPAPPIPR